MPSADSTRSSEGNHLSPPHRLDFKDCKQILEDSLTPRCTLKPGQDFSRTSRQKTCPNGHKESEDCHSASVPLRCTPSERQSSSRQQYPRLRPGYRKEKRSGDFRLSPPANLANSAILPTDKITTFFMQNFLLQKPKDSSWSMPLGPHRGRMITREQVVPRPKVSAFRPRHNIIG